MSEQMHLFGDGAKRGNILPYFSKIPYEALEQEAEAWTVGSMRYDDNPLYEENWKKGDAIFARACIDHAVKHIYKFLSGDTEENHLANARCNLGMAIWFRENGVYDPANPPVEEEEVLPEPEPEPEEDRMAKALRILGIKK
jgi:hypothetical protein